MIFKSFQRSELSQLEQSEQGGGVQQYQRQVSMFQRQIEKQQQTAQQVGHILIDIKTITF